eukprot:COSAG01_NODE_11417_length_1939_cov_1.454348_3_plen_213_part_01
MGQWDRPRSSWHHTGAKVGRRECGRAVRPPGVVGHSPSTHSTSGRAREGAVRGHQSGAAAAIIMAAGRAARQHRIGRAPRQERRSSRAGRGGGAAWRSISAAADCFSGTYMYSWEPRTTICTRTVVLIPLLSTFQNFAIRLMSGVATRGAAPPPPARRSRALLTLRSASCLVVTPHAQTAAWVQLCALPLSRPHAHWQAAELLLDGRGSPRHG